MKRKTTALALILMATVLAGASAEAKVTLKLWHFWGGTRIPLMNKTIADFEKKNPGIKVQHMFINPDDRVQKLLPAIISGAPPDVIMIGRQDVPAFVMRRVLRPIDDYMKRDRISGDMFYKAEYAHCVYQGKTWLLPMPTGGGCHLLFYNKQIFKEAGLDPSKPPKTWADLEVYSRKTTVQGAGNTLKRIGFNPWVAPAIFKPFLYSNNGEWLSADGKKVTLNSPKAVDTLKFLAEYWTRVYGTGKFSVGDAWNKGSQSMILDGTWQIYYMIAAKAKFDYGIGMIPHNDGAQSHGTIDGGWGYAIPGNAKHPAESWKLVKYLTTDPVGAGAFYKEQMRPSPVKSFNKDPFFKEHVDDWDSISDAMDEDIALPITPVNPELDAAMLAGLNSVQSKKRSPEAAIQWITSESQKILDTFWKKNRK